MRKILLIYSLLLFCESGTTVFPMNAASLQTGAAVLPSDTSSWFEQGALRMDLILAGNQQRTSAYLDELYYEPYWSGSPKGMVDSLGFGSFRVKVYRQTTGELVYSNGFSTLFQEWQTTPEARQVSRAFDQVVRLPFPAEMVRVEVLERLRDGSYSQVIEVEVDPASMFIRRDHFTPYPVSKVVDSGDPSSSLDLVFVAEGYLPDQMGKFREDVREMAEYILAQPPFDRYHDRINFWAVESPSPAEGPSNPGQGFYNRTPAGTTYYSLGLDRYLTTARHGQLMDAAANAPGDVVCVLVNTEQYGGGGIYNTHIVGTADHPWSHVVFIHEIGHGLAGLGDEYFGSEVAYEEFYPLDVEPWEANLTTLVDFESKWKDMLEEDIPLPTPAEEPYLDRLGVFEGGGYASEGVYRPTIHCRMRSNTAPGFCPVCQNTLSKVIETYLR
jgi:hypothetical protein